MKKYYFLLICHDGGYGWGKTGQIGRMIIEAKNISKAEEELKKHLPGGWRYVFEGIIDRGDGFVTDLFMYYN